MKIWNIFLITFTVFAVLVSADLAAIKAAAVDVADLAVVLKTTVEKEQGTVSGSHTPSHQSPKHRPAGNC